jgi:SRSO17 transposase
METREIEQFRSKLEAFLADLVLPMSRKDRRQHAEEYVRCLLMDGERKSIEPMANRLPEGDVQAL